MKITDLISVETICLDLKSKTKSEVIDELVDILDKAGKLNDKEAYKKEILKRETVSSTGLEEGIAIPHGKTKAVKIPAIAFGYSKEGIDYESLDDEPSKLFFMIAASEDATDSHIETLSRLTTYLLDDSFREKLLQVKTKEEVINLIDKKEREETEVSEIKNSNKPFVLAVTACPTGIAHTYMAANSLKEKAKEMGVEIKVETNGSTGVKNELTKEEIARAEAIIVAADKKVEMSRFNGKHVIEVPVIQGIKNPEELIARAIKKDAPIYRADSKTSKIENDNLSPVAKYFYKPLMNGVSYMLPFVVGGGILIAISFLFGIKAFDPADPSFNPIAKFLMDIGGGGAFALMIPILAGFIGMGIADRPGFMPAMVGGFMAKNAGGGFLGGLIAGFVAGYIVLFIKNMTKGMPESLEGLKPVLIYPLFSLLLTGLIMKFLLIPISGINAGMANFLNNMGTGNLVLLGIVLGGMMAVDMGGPVNKAAFTFGIAAIEAGNLAPHAAVMAGGMVPPLAIAIATTIFKNKFTEEERENGLTNYIMGASFITEGAIPFAAADPLLVIPACITGSAIAGGLAMVFGNTLPAPHGGIFVIPLVHNWPMYIVAILVGSLVTATIIGLVKKPVIEENKKQVA
ncbi:MAG: fructose system or component [Fusobacteriaceae bacterium]|jgi:PTS system fructose-specific IIC component|nr:system D-fructose-specific component (F1P-forming), Frc family [Fusobacteriales bacterium]MDN5304496.1 fructose system or component [Fusobacteriaceae bacterium]